MTSRAFGKRSGLEITPVSIGAMRLPADLDDAVQLIRHAIDSGMRYIDTSRGYGESEWVLGKALKNGYREKVILSTKCSPWVIKPKSSDDSSADTIRRRIDESMQRLDVEYLDFFQVWAIGTMEQYNLAIAPNGMVDGIKKAMKEGLIKHTGFTSHLPLNDCLTAIRENEWAEVILLTYNLFNRTFEPAFAEAKKRGIGTIVMNPVGGGKLGEQSPFFMKMANAVGAVSEADLAVRYVLSNPNVDTILCGMTRLSDVDNTIASAKREPFTAQQLTDINNIIDPILSKGSKFCTWCKYCQPCPKQINIPEIMSIVFDFRNWGFEELSRKRYKDLQGAKADACTKCRKCETKCTQKLGIVEVMEFAASEFK